MSKHRSIEVSKYFTRRTYHHDLQKIRPSRSLLPAVTRCWAGSVQQYTYPTQETWSACDRLSSITTSYICDRCARIYFPCRSLPPDKLCTKRRYPDGTATHAVKIVAAKETAAAAAVDGDAPAAPAEEDLEEERGAIAWCALHGRAAASAEDELAVELAARDAKVQEAEELWYLSF